MQKTKNGTHTQANGKAQMPTHNDLPEKVRSQMIALCNEQLADTFDLMSQVKQAHWNVRGPHFFSLHKLFDEVAEVVEGYVDMLAERATALGGIARGTCRMAASSSRLPEYPEDIHNGIDHVAAVTERISMLCKSSREAIEAATDADDQATADLFTEMVRDLDKYLWFVEAHIRA